ncbi:5-oxoprolinase/urea amidolyase family protein [Conexibacter sp. SYSU D00693]|uniref:5-oxoprolinase/urea amidolyase family protein n=1 Tax=Conexibacter sp. SYSU D00693 TaxID=2812560 RepID=UPI00196A21A3|nr:5-oxoprolinase/urea amidolyase family protein [Conexibacter sp. SYSU D00693]
MALEVLAAGPMATVQEHPGRRGLWPVGVPPSGPMDALSFRLANRIAGNPGETAAIEVTVGGFRARFDGPATVVLGGADPGATLDGEPVGLWEPIAVAAGEELALGFARGPGMRTYVAVTGGIDVPEVLGSRATFPLGGFGGFEGRPLAPGDRLPVDHDAVGPARALNVGLRPVLRRDWTLRVRRGPHDIPEYLTDEDLASIFGQRWTVGAQSDRTGVRLEGDIPDWARTDGGDAGLHPSNLHDNAYVVGSLIFTGDTPVLIGPDGPSLGGFVSPCVVVQADQWKLGQLRPGDTVGLECVDAAQARWLDERQERALDPKARPWRAPAPVRLAADAGSDVVVRRCGDGALLVEFGEMTLDLRLRLRAHALEQRLEEAAIDGVRDLTAGIRSLQVQFDPREVAAEDLEGRVRALAAELGDVDDLEVRGRVVHLPLSWDDPQAREAVARYMRIVRPDAPWCPDNIEFIRRVNGLASAEDVHRVVFDASYLVLGLGDVYLGAPVAVPLDPRHRLVTTKYNPARTWTPENAVGIGGAYLCVYGMEGPGGYQLVGRTTQVWNPRDIEGGTPWRLRAFDQLRFHPVSTEELGRLRAAYAEPRTEDVVFRLADHLGFVDEHAGSIAAFRATQQAAFAAERDAWRAVAA